MAINRKSTSRFQIEETVSARTEAEKNYHGEFGLHQIREYGGEENE